MCRKKLTHVPLAITILLVLIVGLSVSMITQKVMSEFLMIFGYKNIRLDFGEDLGFDPCYF